MNIWDELLDYVMPVEGGMITQTPENETATTPDGTEGATDEMRIGTHNIRNFPDISRQKVRASAQLAASITDICGLQEIQEQTDKDDISKAMDGFEFVALTRRPPIAYRPKKVQLSHNGPRGFVQVSEPVRGFMPELGFTVATFQSVARPALAPFIVVNVHYPPGAFNNAVKDHKKWRIDTWNTYHSMMIDFIAKWNSRGYTIFVVGDCNRHNMPVYAKQFRWIYGGTIDNIGVITGSVGIDVKEKLRKTTPSDHDAYAIRAKLTNKKRN